MQPVSIKPTITLDDLKKVDIRVGTIEHVNDVPNSDKLVRLTVDFGDHRRTILAGIKKMEMNIQKLATGFFGSMNFITNRFTGPGRIGIQSMYLHMPTNE